MIYSNERLIPKKNISYQLNSNFQNKSIEHDVRIFLR